MAAVEIAEATNRRREISLAWVIKSPLWRAVKLHCWGWDATRRQGANRSNAGKITAACAETPYRESVYSAKPKKRSQRREELAGAVKSSSLKGLTRTRPTARGLLPNEGRRVDSMSE